MVHSTSKWCTSSMYASHPVHVDGLELPRVAVDHHLRRSHVALPVVSHEHVLELRVEAHVLGEVLSPTPSAAKLAAHGRQHRGEAKSEKEVRLEQTRLGRLSFAMGDETSQSHFLATSRDAATDPAHFLLLHRAVDLLHCGGHSSSTTRHAACPHVVCFPTNRESTAYPFAPHPVPIPRHPKDKSSKPRDNKQTKNDGSQHKKHPK